VGLLMLGAVGLLALQPVTAVVPPSGIAKRAGQRVIVCAAVTDITRRDTGAVVLTIARPPGGQKASIVIAAPGPDDPTRYQGKPVCATGTARTGSTGPYVDVASDHDIVEDTFGAGAFKPSHEISLPKPIQEAKPAYPGEALQAGIEGTVVVEAIVLPTGQIGDVRLVESIDPLLDRAALDAARRWQFIPGMRYGQPVPVLITLEMAFKVADWRKR
jgi:protein TonB